MSQYNAHSPPLNCIVSPTALSLENSEKAFYDGSRERGLTPEPKQFLDAGEPPIVFTLGSAAVLSPGDFYKDSVQAAKQLNRRAVLLIGKNPPPENLPEGIVASNYAPIFT